MIAIYDHVSITLTLVNYKQIFLLLMIYIATFTREDVIALKHNIFLYSLLLFF